jgi:hypothetical protein
VTRSPLPSRLVLSEGSWLADGTPLVEYFAGYADVDGDGIVDCMDPFIRPTADNVDGDFLPDRYDPDLPFDHRPYSWMYATHGGVGAAAGGILRMLKAPGSIGL